jgi:putative addiction module killer protein
LLGRPAWRHGVRLDIIIAYDNYYCVSFVVREYVDDSGRIPFRDWLGELDLAIRARVQARVLRFETGNLGDHKEVGGGVWEARLDFGPGYRLYFGRSGREVILLLLGGDKRSQKKDIKRAREFWATYLKELKHGKTQ